MFFVVVHNVQAPIVQHWRCGKPPSVARLDHRPFLFPQQDPFQTVTKETVIPEIGIDPFPVSDRRFRSVTVLDMNIPARLTGKRCALPLHLAGLQTDTQHFPMMCTCRRLITVTPKVQALAGLPLPTLCGHSGDENLISPHHRRGPASPGNRRFPPNIFRGTPLFR